MTSLDILAKGECGVSPPRFSVIVVSYRSVDRLKQSLESLRRQSLPEFEAIVLNNDLEEQATFKAIAQAFNDKRFSFHSMSENSGFAGGVNRGARLASGKWIATLNPDAYADATWLERAAATIDAGGPDITMVASVQVLHSDNRLLDGAGDCYAPFGIAWRGGHGHKAGLHNGSPAVFAPCGAAAFYRRDEFTASGGFCERYFCYFEDVDLAFRLRLRGGRCLLATRAVVSHEGGVSSGGPGSAFAVRQGMRNMPQTFLRCMPLALLLPMLPLHVAMLLALLVRHSLRGCGAAAIQGLHEAILSIPAALAERHGIQYQRKISLQELSAILSWNPVDALLRRTARSLRSGALR